MPALVERLKALCAIAKSTGLGVTIDAEEADRLELSLEIVSELLQSTEIGDWPGLGIVVQSYQRRAPVVIDTLIAMARASCRSISVRLV